jgi:hypothetical protein
MEKILTIQRRFFRKEKNEFLDTVEEKLNEYGYDFERKNFGSIIKSVNLETKSSHPEFIFIAHYDTGTIMPFWISWLLRFFGVNNQILMTLPIFFLMSLFVALGHFHIGFNIAYWIICISLLTIFIPNRKNFDDNTSGVVALLSLAKKCKENGMDNVKFIFFDNEELGLIGSSAHKNYLNKERLILPHSKIISLDCVGVGEFPLIIRNSKSDYESFFQKALQNEFEFCKSIQMILPASDNFSFRKYGALNISFAKKAVIPFGYSLSKIHSSDDNYMDLRKIEKLTDALMKAIETVTLPSRNN